MQYYLDIKTASSDEWLDAVMNDFNSFLIDHADCERKASSFAMGMVAKYPNRVEIIPELIETGIEELEHFQQVYTIMEERGLQLPHKIEEDPYLKQLIKKCHSGRNERFLDRLLIGSVVETRGAERFRLVCDALKNGDLHLFYKELWTAEAKHGNIFVKMALNYFDKDVVYDRLKWWIDIESEIIESLPVRAALH